MLILTFKDVGHGDSIILEWEEHNKKKIAFIDCCISDNSFIPSLEYLKANHEFKYIEFMILSHPHYDHYSGFCKLLEYCFKQNITIGKFMHTAYRNPNFFVQKAVKSKIAKIELSELYIKIKDLRKINLIQQQGFLCDDFEEMFLSDSLKIKVIAPTYKEFEDYDSQVKFSEDDESCHNHANANLLSTVLQIYNDEWFILLTSDCYKQSLEYLFKEKHSRTKANFLYLGQSPHHGSMRNHNDIFWESINRKPDSKIVFSCGINSYNHPSHEVVKFFHDKNFKIEYTHRTGGLSYEDLEIDNISVEMNLSSELITAAIPNSERGDRTFKAN